jgi:hypothetical protein
MSRAPDGGCVAPTSIAFAVNTEFEGRAFVTPLAGETTAEKERGSTGTSHCGDIHIANGNATLLTSVA